MQHGLQPAGAEGGGRREAGGGHGQPGKVWRCVHRAGQARGGVDRLARDLLVVAEAHVPLRPTAELRPAQGRAGGSYRPAGAAGLRVDTGEEEAEAGKLH